MTTPPSPTAGPAAALRRVLAEARRELTRPSALRLHVAAAAVAAVFGALAVVDFGVEGHLIFMYAFLPLLFLPVGAHMGTRDRERGMAPLLATTPLTQGEALAAKALSLALVVVASLAVTAPTAYAVASDAGTAAPARVTAALAWGALLGLASALAGLLIGHLAVDRTVHAISAAFLLGVAWLLAGVLPAQVVALADTEAGRQALLALVHGSPVTWLTGALWGGTFHPFHAAKGSPGAAWGAALVGVAALALAATVALRMQHATGWRPRLRRSDGAPVAAAVLLVLVAALHQWGYAAGDYDRTAEWRGQHATDDYRLRAQVRGPDGGSLLIREGGRALLTVEATGDPNATLTVTDATLRHPHIAFTRLDDGPLTLDLGENAYQGAGGAVGRDVAVAGFEMQPTWVQKPRHQIMIHLTIDGEPVVFSDGAGFVHVPAAPVALAAAASLALAWGGAALVARRLDPW